MDESEHRRLAVEKVDAARIDAAQVLSTASTLAAAKVASAAVIAAQENSVHKGTADLSKDAMVVQLLAMIDNLYNEVVKHIQSEQGTVNEIVSSIRHLEEKVELLSSAFPGGNHQAHREYHELLIENIRARKEFWKKLTADLIRLGVIGFLVWAGIALWRAFLTGPK